MSRGRHRGRAYWGVFPPTGRNFAFLAYDIAAIAFRCFATGIFILGLVGVVLIAVDIPDGLWHAVWAAFSMAGTLFAVGLGIARYHRSALQYSKAHQANEWLRVVHELRIERLVQREQFLMSSITQLHDHFEEEKAALQEIREERIAQERMVGFVDGIQKSPEMMAYLANPRNRLRVVPSPDEESA